MQACEVVGCKGVYEKTLNSYIDLTKANTTSYRVSVETYNSLQDKGNYVAVVGSYCNICNDSLDDRLINFIREEFKP